MATVFHADDFGIDLKQARDILALSDACGGCGALSSVSIFVNSNSFFETAESARPFVERGALAIRPHINLVEGYPCAAAGTESPLVNERGAFGLDFVSLLRASMGPRRDVLARAVRRECRAQIERFCDLFPEERGRLALDGHQHVHMIPLVFDALMQAAADCGCTVASMRIPRESLAPYLASPHEAKQALGVNDVKDAVITACSEHALKRLPSSCRVPLFCGVILSGGMDRIGSELVERLEERGRAQGRDVELLFHPVSMEPERCLDPENKAFTQACCSPRRDAEARCIAMWHNGPDGRAIAPE